ncbi:hypothetical protein [Streptomyces sp.]|uniref:hypothetical protein n=1 Tax=Streptomyces sp. TaxID=1931 RepID=UPI0028122DAB|nr:hypothetical protein [Streptomyces sp.]
MARPVPQHAVLNVFHLLRRVEPTAAVVGTKEVARIGGLVFTLSLAPSIWHDRFQGLRLTAISPTAGELATTLLSFEDYKVTTGTGAARRPLRLLDEYNAGDLFNGVSTDALEEAVAAFTASFAAPEPSAN